MKDESQQDEPIAHVQRHRVNFQRSKDRRKTLHEGVEPVNARPKGRIPRIARLMALAIHFEDLVNEGVVNDYAEIARLGHVTRARVTQIMNLRLLAPDIQEAILNLPRTFRGRDAVRERHVRPIAAEPDWNKQRRMWDRLTS